MFFVFTEYYLAFNTLKIVKKKCGIVKGPNYSVGRLYNCLVLFILQISLNKHCS